jgi:TRAP-type C4-dicarboxylate transport system permease small subunit
VTSPGPIAGAARILRAVAENVAAALLAAMFIAFMLQIVSRYVLNNPLGWTLEVCLTTWLWLVLWGGGTILQERDHVRFDILYQAVRPPVRRAFAVISALALIAAIASALPASLDYITFYAIKSSSTLGIRLDYVFSIYAIFSAALVLRYAARLWHLLRGADVEALDQGKVP